MINAEFIERYQLEYQKNPRSKVFAPLAEGYRRLGLLKEAHEVAEAGVKYHPDFASGRVALGRILMELKKPDDALAQLKKAAELSPDNWMAHSLMGDLFLQLRRPKEALKAFKMVLFLHPQDEKAKKAVQKWEFLTADEYEDDLFEMKPVFRATPIAQADEVAAAVKADAPLPDFLRKQIDRALSLADAFTVRNELGQAIEVLQEAQRRLGAHSELADRLALMTRRFRSDAQPNTPSPPAPANTPSATANPRKNQLEILLQRIQDRRLS
jgi:tetratricopeptide (TPR) repeat protein